MSDSVQGRVLIVDEDYDTLERLAEVMRRHGHRVVLATDGRAGLAHAVELQAEVVLVDRDVRVLDVRTFVDVLTENPRTQGAHVFVLGRGDPTDLSALEPRGEPIVKPFHAEEVAARVNEVVRARREPTTGPELEGELQQVAAFDLLQVFAQSRRTGLLRIEGASLSGEIYVREGRVVSARSNVVTGEKALYRLLSLTEGQFVFLPGRLAEIERIDASTDHLLMEAVRRTDERAALEKELPSRSTVLAPSAAAAAPDDPLARAVVGSLAPPRSFGEILDRRPELDLEVMRAVAALLREKRLEVVEPGVRVRLCEPEEEPVIRGAMVRMRRPGVEGAGRIGVSGSATAVSRFHRALGGLEEFFDAPEPPTRAGSGLFGILGRLRLGGVELELFALPPDPALRPWWAAFLTRGRTVLALEPVEGSGGELRLVEAESRWDTPAGATEVLRAMLGRRP